MAVKFEDLTMAEVHARAGTEGGVQRGKALYGERSWTQVRDEMAETGAKKVADLPRARIRLLRAAIKPNPTSP